MKYTFLPLLLYSFIFVLLLVSCQSNTGNKRYLKHKNSLADNIGEKFQLSNILDSSGKAVNLDFTKADLTIIDFWFNNCPPCIEEMNQFASLLSGKEKKVAVISISINQVWLWKEIVRTHTGRFSFLDNKASNWTQYVLQTKDDKMLKNEISSDRLVELQKKYNITFLPAYFVVDRNAIIKARPANAVYFISKL